MPTEALAGSSISNPKLNEGGDDGCQACYLLEAHVVLLAMPSCLHPCLHACLLFSVYQHAPVPEWMPAAAWT